MKPAFTVLLLLLASSLSVQAGSKEFKYDDFGPQVAVHELLGFGWFQWDSHGDEDPRTDPRIKVVVYWNEELEDVKRQYPVDQATFKDFRFLELGRAIEHLENLIPEFESANLSSADLQATLRALKEIRGSERATDGNPH